MRFDNRSIGIFDSGIGGLTVLSGIRKKLQGESMTYLGDTARVPYGTKSSQTIIRYARQNVEFLLKRDVKAIVVACNTISAWALPQLQKEFKVPILGVIDPGAREGVKMSRKKKIGVIATRATIESGAYEKAILAVDPDIDVISKACGLFVPVVEEGFEGTPLARLVVEEYLSGMAEKDIDTLILGCTHYPLLAGTMKEFLGDGISLVDSASATANAIGKLFLDGVLLENSKRTGDVIYVTDLPSHFEKIASRFLDDVLPKVEQVDL